MESTADDRRYIIEHEYERAYLARPLLEANDEPIDLPSGTDRGQ